MTTAYSHAEIERIEKENDRLRAKDAREKSTALEYTEKAVVILSAAAVGGGMGVYAAMQGATAENPVLVAGTVPLDAAVAGLGAIAVMATPVRGPSSSFMPAACGAGGAAVGLWSFRAGFQWQQARAGTAPAAPAATTQGYLGAGSMSSRFAAPSHGAYGVSDNPYVSRYAG